MEVIKIFCHYLYKSFFIIIAIPKYVFSYHLQYILKYSAEYLDFYRYLQENIPQLDGFIICFISIELISFV